MSQEHFKRWSLSAAVIVAVGIFYVLYSFDPQLYYSILTAWGLVPFRFPFVDSYAVLSAIQCHRLGVDVLVENTCMNGFHAYSPLWLALDVLPITTGWTTAVGLCLCLLFAISLAFLPLPRTWLRTIAFGAFLFSTMPVYAIERGNTDVLIFLLSLVSANLLSKQGAARSVAYLVILAAGLLKFYPFAGLAAAVAREKPRRFLVVALAGAVVLTVFGAFYFHQLAAVMKVIPTGPYYIDQFGAKNLPLGFREQFAAPIGRGFPLLAGFTHWLPQIVSLALLTLLGLRCHSLAGDDELRQALDRTTPQASSFLLLGSILLVACFFAGQSIYYRGILFLLVVPGLFAVQEKARSPRLARQIGSIGAAILFLMWSECVRQGLPQVLDEMGIAGTTVWYPLVTFWLVRELVWWWVIASLAGLIVGAITQSVASRSISRVIGSGQEENA